MHVSTGDPIAESVSPELYFTRYLTHLCAPVFIFLAGISAWLYGHPAGREPRSVTSFLFKRGLVLIAFDVGLYYLLWIDTISTTIWLQVLWAIGVSMLGLAVLSRFNLKFVGLLGLLIVFGHNALSPIEFAPGHWAYIPWSILHDQNNLGEIAGLTIRASYPVLPWFGVILLGYSAGPLFSAAISASDRRRTLVILGISCIAVMLLLRGLNVYGETLPWHWQDTTLATVRDFMNFSKYPPSLLYLLTTLGIGMLLLAWLDTMQHNNAFTRVLKVYGEVPMFAYFSHLYLLLALYWLLFMVFGPNQGERFGFSAVWHVWVGAAILIAVLYLPTQYFGRYKHTNKKQKPWLSYL